MSRIFIFTGKGGVGKTSIAAAHAVLSAKEEKKTLLVSTDMAHNLSDLFGQPLGHEEVRLQPHLDVLELNPSHIMEEEFHDVKRAFVNLFSSFQMSEDHFAQLTGFPGMDELICLLKILQIYENGEYERIIVDCAPTGETLSLLKFPELLSWYMEKFFPVGKVAMRVLSPISKTLFKVELPDQKAMTDIERIYTKLIKLQALLKDPSISSIRLVCIPEKMVVEETKRNYMYMNLYNFHVDGVYINRILPKLLTNPFFEEWMQIQSGYIKELSDVFDQIPIYHIPWFDTDLNGIDGLQQLIDSSFSDCELFQSIDYKVSERYEKTEQGYQLLLCIPCAKKEEIDLHVSGSDVIIKLGNFKRNIPLPNALRRYKIENASVVDQQLRIHFTPEYGGTYDE